MTTQSNQPSMNGLQHRITSIKNAAALPTQVYTGETLNRIVALVANDVTHCLKLSPTKEALISITAELKQLTNRLFNKQAMATASNQEALIDLGTTMQTLMQLVQQQLWIVAKDHFEALSNPYDATGELKTQQQMEQDCDEIKRFEYHHLLTKESATAIQYSQSIALSTIGVSINLFHKPNKSETGAQVSELTYAVEQLVEANEVMKEAAQFLEALMNDTEVMIPTVIRENGVLLSQQLAELAGLNDED